MVQLAHLHSALLSLWYNGHDTTGRVCWWVFLFDRVYANLSDKTVHPPATAQSCAPPALDRATQRRSAAQSDCDLSASRLWQNLAGQRMGRRPGWRSLAVARRRGWGAAPLAHPPHRSVANTCAEFWRKRVNDASIRAATTRGGRDRRAPDTVAQ